MTQDAAIAMSAAPTAPASLKTLREQGNHYALLNVALRQLERDPNDANVAMAACESYIALGLFGPARGLLSDLIQRADEKFELRALLQQIARSPSGRVAWGSLQARFESNLEQLCRAHPEMREREAVFREIPRHYELYRAADGNVHLARRSPEGRLRWVHDLRDADGLVARARLPHDPKALWCGPYLVAGDCFCKLLTRIFDGTRKMFLTFSPRIYVLEPDVSVFGAALYVLESVESLCHERTGLFVGADCVERFAASFAEHPERSAPAFAVRLTARGEALCDQAAEALRPRSAALESKARETLAAMQRHYDSLPAEHWMNRFSPERDRPLRVLGLVSRFTTYLQYSMRDWRGAFQDAGHEFRVLTEENDHDLLPPIRTAETIEEYKPDLIVCVDHFRHEYQRVIPRNVPFVGWIQDALPHLYSRKCGESLGELDYFVARNVRGLHKKYGYPPTKGFVWPMVTSERVFRAEPMPDEALAPYRCDVSFVSSHSKPPDRAHDERRKSFKGDPSLLRLVDRLFDVLRAAHTDDPAGACARAESLFQHTKQDMGLATIPPDVEDVMLTSYVYPMIELIFRQAALTWVADYCDRTGRVLHLYGNGWEAHPRFGCYARGFARNGEELRAIYQASAINLQITTFGAVHQRLLDGLAAGGFFLIRRTPADTVHVLAKKVLAAVRKFGARADTVYRFGEMPELDAAMRDFWAFYGVPAPRDQYSIRGAALEQYEEFEAAQFNQVAGAVFERYAEVAFASSEEFARQAERYLADPAQRADASADMRKTVCSRFTYGALVDGLLTFIAADMARAGGSKGMRSAACTKGE